jgi:YVTN family beta-propeller protein
VRVAQVLAVACVLTGLGLSVISLLGAAPGSPRRHVDSPRAFERPSGPAVVAAALRRTGADRPLRLGPAGGPATGSAPAPAPLRTALPIAAPTAPAAGLLGFGLAAPAARPAAPLARVSSLRVVRPTRPAGRLAAAAPPQVTPTATVTVGHFPTGVAVGAARAYVANANSNTVSVLNTTANPVAVVATVPVGVFPIGVALSADGSQAYVANFTAGTLSVIDAATNTVTHTVAVGSRPDGVIASGGSVYVANLLSGTISVVDPAAGTVTSTITLGGNAAPSGLAVAAGRLYADDARNGRTYVVDLGTATVLGSVASGTHPAYLALAGSVAYVASPGSNSVTVLDDTTTPPTAGASIPVGTAPYGVAAVPTSELVLATNSGSNNLSVINSATNSVIGTPVALGSSPDAIAVSPDHQTAIVTNENSDTVSVLHVNQPPVAGPVSFSGAVGNTVFGVGAAPAAPSSSATGTVLSNSSDPEGNALTVAAGTIATAQGGSVVLAGDGTFTYTPAVGFVGADTFPFTVSDGGPVTSSATATIHVANRVWYVRNNDTGANDGRSISPFHTLAQAQSASSTGDYIYVFKGDGTATGQSAGIVLKSGQHLVGAAQGLVVGSATLISGAAGNRPPLTASSGSVVALADGVVVSGLAANPSGTANGLSGGPAGATINDVTVSDTGSGEGITLTNATGAVAITSSPVTGGGDDAVVVTNSTGTLNLTLTGDTFSEPNTVTGNDALNITTTGAAAVSPTISGSAFTAARGDLFQLNIGDTSSSTLSFMNNTLSNSNTNIVSGGGGVTISAGGGTAPAAKLTFDIEHNTFRDSLGNAVGIGSATGNNTIRGTFSNNTVGVAAVANSGSAQGGDLSVVGIDGGSIAVTAESNSFYQYNNAFGVNFAAGGAHSMDVKFDSNTIASPSGGNRATGLLMNAGTSTGSTNTVCFDGFSNHLTGSGAGGNNDVLYRQRNSATVRLPGYTGSATTVGAVESFVAGLNPPSPTVLVTINSTGFTGGPACATP